MTSGSNPSGPLQSGPASPGAVPPPAREGRGCFFYGCLVVILLLLLAVGFILYALPKAFDGILQDKPGVVPTVAVAVSHYTDVNKRLSDFRNSLQIHAPTAPLVLTSDDINSIIAYDPKLATMKDKVHVTVVGDEIGAEFSFSLRDFGIPLSRYINGSGSVRASLDNGKLVVNITSLRFGDNSLPPEAISGLKNKNFAEQFDDDAEFLHRLQKIEVRDGKVIISPLPESASPEKTAAPAHV